METLTETLIDSPKNPQPRFASTWLPSKTMADSSTTETPCPRPSVPLPVITQFTNRNTPGMPEPPTTAPSSVLSEMTHPSTRLKMPERRRIPSPTFESIRQSVSVRPASTSLVATVPPAVAVLPLNSQSTILTTDSK